jgi:uncharacterized protein YggE
MKRAEMKRAATALALLALGILAMTGCSAATAAPGAAPADGPGITARGTGTVTGTPDTVTIALGVQTRAETATAALDANSARTTALLDALQAAGVPPADRQTSRLAVHAVHDRSGTRITGYEVTNQVTASLHDVGSAGAVIDAAAQAAGDAIRVDHIGFSISDDSDLRARARADAVRQAMDQAGQLAEAAGVELGPIRSITELQLGPPQPYRVDGAPAAEAMAVPIEPGTQELTVTVEVVHGIG